MSEGDIDLRCVELPGIRQTALGAVKNMFQFNVSWKAAPVLPGTLSRRVTPDTMGSALGMVRRIVCDM